MALAPLLCYPFFVMEKALILLRRYALVLAFLAVVLAGVALYAFGFRLSTGGLVRAGTLIVTPAPDGTEVFTDQSRVTRALSGEARVDLLPGSHSLIVSAPGMQPWSELVIIESGKDTVFTPILVPIEPIAKKLTGEERATAVAALLAYSLPTKESPLVLSGGCALVYTSGNRVIADATTTPSCTAPDYLVCAPGTEGTCPSTVIFPPNERLESVSAVPGRDDALVIAAGSQAYVVELDPRQPQFFAPIMKATRVRSAPWTESSIIISDTKDVYELPL